MKNIFVAAILLCVSYPALPQTKTGLKTTTLPFCATDGHVPDAFLKIGHSELLAQATTASNLDSLLDNSIIATSFFNKR